MTHRVIVSLASNSNQKHNLAEARRCLGEALLHDELYSDELWTEPVGGSRPDLYLNQVVAATTTLDADSLSQQLKAIEARLGRTAEARRCGVVPIDLDLLSFDGCRFHLRDWQRPYVRDLLPQIATKEQQ